MTASEAESRCLLLPFLFSIAGEEDGGSAAFADTNGDKGEERGTCAAEDDEEDDEEEEEEDDDDDDAMTKGDGIEEDDELTSAAFLDRRSRCALIC